MNERGQVTVLILGFLVVVMGVLGVAVDGTKAFIHRRTLQNAADAAALAAASELDSDVYYSSGGSVVRLNTRMARATAIRWLGERGISARPELSVDSGRISIVLRDSVPSGILGLVGIDRLPVAVESVAAPFAGSP